jgi:DNA polymerase-3 subunit beta
MKFRIQKDHFVEGLHQVLSVVGSKPSTPLLSHVMLEAKEGRITFTTTNLDIGIRCHVRAEVLEPGTIALPAKRLATIVKALPSVEVAVDAAVPHQVKVTSGGSQFRIVGMEANDFPAFPPLEPEHRMAFKPEGLQKMLRSVAYAQSTDENRFLLNGVHFAFEGNQASAVATDGRRLAICSETIDTPVEQPTGIIIPAKTINEVVRLIDKDQSVEVLFHKRQVAFHFKSLSANESKGLVDEVVLVSKLTEGQFPNYQQVVPKETAQRIALERQLFLECIERASLVSSDRSQAVRIHLSANLLEVKASSAEFGDAHESIAVAYEGPETQIAFNPSFLIDLLKALVQDEVFFEFKDEMSPGVFRTKDHFLCVVMPLCIN